MVHQYQQNGLAIPFKRTSYKLIIAALASIIAAATVFVLASFSAHALTVSTCEFDDTTPGVWSLTASCTTTAQINVPGNTVVEGNGYTVSAGFAKTSNSNNAVFGVYNDNTTVQNLTIDGSAGVNLHGINTYLATGVVVDNVTINNINRIGVNVNGSQVSVSNYHTTGSGWWAIDVDQGSGVTQPSVLTLGNGNTHAETVSQVYVDDSTKDVTVNDLYGNYDMTPDPFNVGSNDVLYTLHVPVMLANKESCKKGGWATSEAPVFKNQGQCVGYFAKM